MKRAARRSTVPSDTDVLSSPNVVRIMRVLPESVFNILFPRANEGRGPGVGNGPYTYFNFLNAAAMWPAFCNESYQSTDLDALCKRELASMFAHFSQEVGEHDPHSQYPQWQQGLYYYNELGCSNDPSSSGCEYRGGTCDASTWMGQIWQCPAGIKYFGRGAKQISYNFNYGPFSYALFGDVNVLLKSPWLVTSNDQTNGWLALASAFWFYMTPQSPKPSMHDVVTGFWIPSSGDRAGKRVPGFGVLIMIINGGIECGGSSEVQQAANRIEFYKGFQQALGLTADDPTTLGCAGMLQFDSSSSAFTPSYWEQSWSTQACGVSCQLVSYQTGFSIFDDPLAPDVPYNKCIQYYFGSPTTTSPQSTGTSTQTSPASSCKTCATCVAVPGAPQQVSNTDCAPCGSGTLQTWWPCNVDGLCQCAAADSSTTTTTTTTTAKPTPTTITTAKPVMTTTTAKATKTTTSAKATTTSAAFVSPCYACSTCVALPGNIQSTTDSQCSVCAAETKYAFWPCNVAGPCQCGSGSTSAPTNTNLRSSTTAAPVVGNPCAQCTSCEAIPGNPASAPDSECAQCGQPSLYQWWPCNESNICRCKAGLR